MKKIISKPHIPTKANALVKCVWAPVHIAHALRNHFFIWMLKVEKQNKTKLQQKPFFPNNILQRAHFLKQLGAAGAALPAFPQSSRGPRHGLCQCSQKRELQLPTSIPHHIPTLKTLAACFNGEREWPVWQGRTRPTAGHCLSHRVKLLERPLLWNSNFKVDQWQTWTSQQHLQLQIILLTLDTNLPVTFKICSHYTQHKETTHPSLFPLLLALVSYSSSNPLAARAI